MSNGIHRLDLVRAKGVVTGLHAAHSVDRAAGTLRRIIA